MCAVPSNEFMGTNCFSSCSNGQVIALKYNMELISSCVAFFAVSLWKFEAVNKNSSLQFQLTTIRINMKRDEFLMRLAAAICGLWKAHPMHGIWQKDKSQRSWSLLRSKQNLRWIIEGREWIKPRNVVSWNPFSGKTAAGKVKGSRVSWKSIFCTEFLMEPADKIKSQRRVDSWRQSSIWVDRITNETIERY